MSSIFSERLGRRKSVGTGSVTMIIGAIIQASSYSRAQLIVGRIIAGMGMGIINSTAPVFQSEYSPQGIRGLRMLSWGNVSALDDLSTDLI
jgi:MFS family permease